MTSVQRYTVQKFHSLHQFVCSQFDFYVGKNETVASNGKRKHTKAKRTEWTEKKHWIAKRILLYAIEVECLRTFPKTNYYERMYKSKEKFMLRWNEHYFRIRITTIKKFHTSFFFFLYIVYFESVINFDRSEIEEKCKLRLRISYNDVVVKKHVALSICIVTIFYFVSYM